LWGLDYSNPAAKGIQYINRFFEYEQVLRAKNYTPERRFKYRLEKEKADIGYFLGMELKTVSKKKNLF